jgi:hypothetical protein
MPLPLLAACRELVADFPGARRRVPAAMALPRELAASADRWAAALADMTGAGLVVRSPSRPEAVALAARVAGQLGLGLAEICDNAPGLGPWLIAARLAPLWLPTLGAGAAWRRPEIGHYSGPWFAAAPPEGTIESDPPAADWCVAVPTVPERELLWRAAGLCAPEAARAAASYRQGAGRIAEVAARARQLAAARGAPAPAWSDLTRAVVGGSAGLDARARHSPAEVEEDALVLPAALRRAMRDLVARARLRDRLHADLGPAVTARYRPGLRALFVGESGTGKTLAAHWFAGRLGLPLYRVDLAALTSKWIGETEKNLSEVLGAAEHADAVLLFDEADALFAARTDISDAHDRHANAQTNYLLQRIEEFDGIALLASNSRTRFDPAFVRRLDAILDFPMPEAPARAELWRAHLGQRHGLSPAEIDRLAVAVDIAGGHIRNAVLAAAARALGREAAIGWVEVSAAVAEEYAKLGRPAPHLGP